MSGSEKGDELDTDFVEENDKDTFHIGDTLEVPMAARYTTEELHQMMYDNTIDLCPPYQRGDVWSVEKQSQLLDSIYRNFYMPPILFAVERIDSGEQVRKCVDGKQRLTSILRFIDGLIPYIDPYTKKKWYWTKPRNGSDRDIIPQKFKDEFSRKQVTCVEYQHINEVHERDIFQRVQLGVSLSAAEKLQAISSPRADWIHSLDNQYFDEKHGIHTVINVSERRGQGFQLLAYIAFYCTGIPQQNFCSFPKLGQWLSSDAQPDKDFKRAIRESVAHIHTLATEDKLDAAFTKIPNKVSPVEFIFLGVLMYVLLDCKRSVWAREAYELRKRIRARFSNDIRHRGDIVKGLWELVIEAAERCDSEIDWTTAEPGKPQKKSRRKRTAREDDEEEDEDSGRRTKSRKKKT